MADNFPGSDSLSAPALKMFLITPHASNEVDPLPKAIRCDVPGTVTLRSASGNADVTITMAAGEQLAVRAKYVRAAGTTATIHGLA